MSATLHLPDGRKLRTQTNRRYVVVDVTGTKPFVEYRTDVLDRALARARKGGTYFADDTLAAMARGTKKRYSELAITTAEYLDTMKRLDAHRKPAALVFDTTTGEEA